MEGQSKLCMSSIELPMSHTTMKTVFNALKSQNRTFLPEFVVLKVPRVLHAEGWCAFMEDKSWVEMYD